MSHQSHRNRVAPHINIPTSEAHEAARHADLSSLGFEPCETEEQRIKQLQRLRKMPCSIAIKRTLKSRILAQKVTLMKGFKGWRTRQKMKRNQAAMSYKNLSNRFELWQGSFKEIEGHFGSGVLSYFLFLKWLFQLDIVIFVCILLFVVIPQASLSDKEVQFTYPCSTATNSTLYNNLQWSGDIVANCSADYQDYVNITSTSISNNSNIAVSYIADFFQGTGFMENTVLFYGYYSSLDLSVNIAAISDYISSYNLPLAYLVVTLFYFLLSLILMVKQSAEGVTESIIASEDKFYQYGNKVFGSWDYGLNDLKNVILKKKSVFNEITHDLAEERDRMRRTSRTTRQECGLWTIRICINIFVLAALGGSGYLIYYMTQLSSEIINTWPEYYEWHTAVQFLIEFMPSLTITILNIIAPSIFEKIVIGEDYTPAIEVMITLVRTVFLRLASLGILFATLYTEINCSVKDECNVGSAPCQPLYCWETGIGQQLYKLVLTDFFVAIAVTLLVEFPRKLIVSKCDCKVAKIVGYQQFVIPKNVLDLVYSQTLCWLGAFFSPLIPGICVVKFFFLFYLKKLSLLSNFVPNSRPYRASRSNSFFTIVLLLSFVACCVPVVYVIAIMTPSRGCGPFRPYEVIYNVITTTICDWPSGFQTFLSFITSIAFNILVTMILCLAIYYLSILNRGYKERARLLKDQLLMEGKDKQYLVAKLNDMQGSDGKKLTIKDKQRMSQNSLLTNRAPLPAPAVTVPESIPELTEPTDKYETISEQPAVPSDVTNDIPPGALQSPPNLYE